LGQSGNGFLGIDTMGFDSQRRPVLGCKTH
jgi:hypothetical protein